ncbi:MAG: hypothetical protein O9292_02530 [Rhodobacteraceae bacterium]|nr:hypothetical protein [Paracoccaceae bacterium]
MAIADLLKITLKKPVLSSEEETKEAKKKTLEKLLEGAFSRLESIEILNANGKSKDTEIISKQLALDLVNLSLAFSGKPNTEMGKDWMQVIATVGDQKLTTIFEKYPMVLALSTSSESFTEEKLEDLETKLAELLNDIEKYFSILKKVELKTALSDQMFRWKLQGAFLTFLVFVAVGTIIYRKIKYPDLAVKEVKIYFMTKEEPGPKEENSVRTYIDLAKKGEWVEYSFPISKPVEITEIRLDPTEQARVRLTLESLKFLDSKDKLVYTHDFVWADDLLPKDKFSYGAISDIKMSGKAVSGNLIEMETTGSDPFLHVKMPQIKGVSKLVLKLRHIEAYKKFN